MVRKIALLAFTLGLLTSANLKATTITETLTSLGGNSYRADLTVANNAGAAGASCFACMSSIGQFTFRLYFEPQLYGQVHILATPSNGTAFVETQPGPGDVDYGMALFDVWGGLGVDESQGGFAYSFTWIDTYGSDPARGRYFEVLDRTTVPLATAIENGFTTVSAIPEPETYAMLFAGLGLLGFEARRRRKLQRASSEESRKD